MSHPEDRGRCALDGYFECAAKIHEGCICAQMPKDLFLERLKQKYGQPVSNGERESG